MDMSANGCDAYLDKLRKDCNDLVVEQHAMAVVKNELLPLHNWNYMEEQLVPKGQRCTSNVFFVVITGLRLSTFQDTLVNPEKGLLNVISKLH